MIKELKDKYTYISHLCFSEVENDNGIEVFKSESQDMEKTLAEMKKRLQEIHESNEKRLDVYCESKNVPLSTFCGKEKSVEDYAKIINTLLGVKGRQLYVGEPRDIGVEKGFVIDLTSIIVLALYDKLEVFTDKLSSQVYITTSLKNKINYYYNSLLVKQGKKESTIGVIDLDDGSQKLALNEIAIDNKIGFWKEVYKCISKFNVEDIETPNNRILSLGDFWDKVQFDLIELAKQKDLPYICDDLLIRKLANEYEIQHTNTVTLLENHFHNNFDKYIEVIEQLIDNEYIYATYYGKYIGYLLLYLYKNYNNEAKIKAEGIIKKLLSTKTNFEFYIPIMIQSINNLKGMEYMKICNNIYINENIKGIIDIIICCIKTACTELNFNYSNYEKHITKDAQGIDLNFDIKIV